MAQEAKKNKKLSPDNGKRKSISIKDRNSLEMFRQFASKNFGSKKEK